MHLTNLAGTVALANGVPMPYLGLGVYKTPAGQSVVDAVTYALDAGYRHIDTAAAYANEAGVGQAVRQHATPRADIFLTSKVWNADQGYDRTIRAFHESLRQLGTDYLDLYLQHWPVQGKFRDTWRAMETLYGEGKLKAIGVCNFLQFQLEDLLETAVITPMVNQVELHPFLVQQPLLDFCQRQRIQAESWYPLMHGQAFEVPEFRAMAARYERTVAQLLVRWNLQKGVVVIPKSTQRARIVANAQVFDFAISPADLRALDALDQGRRLGPDPAHVNF